MAPTARTAPGAESVEDRARPWRWDVDHGARLEAALFELHAAVRAGLFGHFESYDLVRLALLRRSPSVSHVPGFGTAATGLSILERELGVGFEGDLRRRGRGAEGTFRARDALLVAKSIAKKLDLFRQTIDLALLLQTCPAVSLAAHHRPSRAAPIVSGVAAFACGGAPGSAPRRSPPFALRRAARSRCSFQCRYQLAGHVPAATLRALAKGEVERRVLLAAFTGCTAPPNARLGNLGQGAPRHRPKLPDLLQEPGNIIHPSFA